MPTTIIHHPQERHTDARLKPEFSDADFKDSPPFLFGESFGNLAKERLDAATTLTYVDRGADVYFLLFESIELDRK